MAGILALSSYLPLPENLEREASVNKEIPIIKAHGRDDKIIPIEQGRSSCQTLIENGYKNRWNEYSMHHTICSEEILMIRSWIKNQLS